MRGSSHEERTRVLARALEDEGLYPGVPFACPYLPGRLARQLTILPSPLSPGIYHALMDLNFRRLGQVFYRPCCEGCGECRSIRIPIPEFEPSPGAYAPAIRALQCTRERLARNGVTDPRHIDMWTAWTTGLVDQQISNDPGGHRWDRLIEDFVAMFLGHCQPTGRPDTRFAPTT